MEDNVLFDREFNKKYNLIAGVDEAGRGPLAGPVVVACVIMPLESAKIIKGIFDSKTISEKKREELYLQIINTAIDYSIQEVSVKVIDSINILNATKLGMKNCINSLKVKPDLVLVDAVKNLDVQVKTEGIIKGDALSYNIGAASILAKVHRDRLMKKLAESYNQYGFEKHKGYCTKLHIENLAKFGPCAIHRRSFLSHFCSEEILKIKFGN